MITKIESEVSTLPQAEKMWKRILKSYLADKVGIDLAFDLGCFLISKYGESVIKISK
tara:strand:+ start:111 stop:281 length:171 start_codon:yes stop_codon:yes gene_type:complete